METPHFEKSADFSVCVWICGGFAPCGPSALLATQKASFAIKTCHLAIPLIIEQKLRTFEDIDFFTFYGSKSGILGQKRCFGVFWTECEVADLKQRQRTTAMDHRNKIQSLVLPTDDPGDAPNCITEYGLLPVNMAIYALNQLIFQNMGFPATQVEFGADGPHKTAGHLQNSPGYHQYASR